MGSSRALRLFLVCGLSYRCAVYASKKPPLPRCDGVCGLELYGEKFRHYFTDKHTRISLLPRYARKERCDGLYQEWTSKAQNFMEHIGMNVPLGCGTEYANITIEGGLEKYMIAGDIEGMSHFHNCSFGIKQFIIDNRSQSWVRKYTRLIWRGLDSKTNLA